MALVTSTEMFKKAYAGGYAIGAFNVNNMEIVQGITEACQEEHAPVILQVSKGARAYANHTYLVKLVEAAVECCPDIPIVLHLDHGPDFETCKSCIDGGFTSVMIDASSKPFAENIEITKKVVEYAHDHGVVVEAELGTLAGIEDEVKVAAHEASYTHPEEVEEFVSKTGCDSLAIAIGTSHGAYKFKPEQCTRNADGILVPPPLRFDVLKEVSKRLPGFPIVLHGSSSVPQEYVKMINDHGGKMPNAIGVPEEQLREAAKQLAATAGTDGKALPVTKTATGTGTTMTVADLPNGLYLIVDSAGSPMIVGTPIQGSKTLNGVTLGALTIKSKTVAIDKKVSRDRLNKGTFIDSKAGGTEDSASFTVGETVDFKYVFTLPNMQLSLIHM